MGTTAVTSAQSRNCVNASVDEEPTMSGQWYFCLRHAQVEGEDGCKNADRMGPYASQEEAARALTTAQQRTEQWDAADEEWEER